MSYLFATKNDEVDFDSHCGFPSVHNILQPGKVFEDCPNRAVVELSNEAFCTWLANYIGLPVDSWQLWASPRALVAPPESGLWFDAGKNYTVPVSRICYASWIPTDDALCYEIIPSKWCSRVTNRNDFLGIVMFDAWTGARQARKTLYVGQHNQELRALFISHGKAFNMCGVTGDIKYDPSIPNMRNLMDIHRDALVTWTEEAIAGWAARLKALDEDSIQRAFEFAYSDWQHKEWEANVRAFIEHRHSDIELIAESAYKELKRIT